MALYFFIKGIILGFSIAAPVGPIGLLCIHRTLTNGVMNGFLSGLGAASADAVYGFIAAFGITAVSSLIISNQLIIRLLGGLFLIYLGYKTFQSTPAEESAKLPGRVDGLGAYTSTFFLTLTNPMTIMSFAAVFAGLGVGTTGGDYTNAAFMVIGVFIGSILWWLVLSAAVNMLREKFDQNRLNWINKISGVIIVLFGVFALISAGI
ncbi:LysE family translocator [Dendrosporobacter sp. 1207_IL3150]|uniref:LysE family translocator n=1 Tax=Dendrosporobacter sp. 1207_IL3150 TaxID=3084054 RepID=UPI002FDAF634